MTNYKAPVKRNLKKKIIRNVLIVAMFVIGGLTIVGADQLGHYLQTHRAGYVDDNR